MSTHINNDHLERDLSFLPVDNPKPACLSQDEIRHYNEAGFVAPFSAYEGQELEKIRDYFDYLLDAFQNQYGKNAYAINGYHNLCEGLYDIVTHDAIVDRVADLIGPNVIAWGSHFFCKLPGDPKHVPWHQDASYWPFSPSRTITVWLAIDDADKENSAMMFLPGTHKKGHLRWKDSDKPAVLNQEIEDIESYGEPFHDELKAGQFSMHADMLAHGSEANNSDRRRCGLTIRYCSPDVRCVGERDWCNNAILCRGEDPFGHWTLKDRPKGENFAQNLTPIGAN